ncbi:MAG: hypothetical protein IPK85_21290 [Gemmatimonadetes bacterium]|nr:hypothetical protein [Gemmatimonadota bacterium]
MRASLVLTNADGLSSPASIELATNSDLAVLRLPGTTRFECGRPWEIAPLLATLTDPAITEVTVHHRTSDGALLQLAARIDSRDARLMRIRPLQSDRPLTTGMSGSLVSAGGTPMAILDSVDTRTGAGIALRIAYADDIVRSFFDVERAADADRAAARLAQLRLQVKLGQDRIEPVCGLNHCQFSVGEQAAVVRAISFGESRDDLDRTIDFSRYRETMGTADEPTRDVHFVRAGADSLFVRVRLDDGTLSVVYGVALSKIDASLDVPVGVRLTPAAVSRRGGARTPPPAFYELGRNAHKDVPQFTVRIDPPLNAALLHLGFDDDFVSDLSVEDLPREGVSVPAEARRVRAAFSFPDGRTTDTTTYILPPRDSVVRVASALVKRYHSRRPMGGLECLRIRAKWPMPDPPDSMPRPERIAYQERRNALRASLTDEGLWDVQSPAVVCRADIARSGPVDSYSWAAVREVHFGTKADTLNTVVDTEYSILDLVANKVVRPDFIRVAFPTDTRGVFARIVYADGTSSPLLRLPVRVVETP